MQLQWPASWLCAAQCQSVRLSLKEALQGNDLMPPFLLSWWPHDDESIMGQADISAVHTGPA